MVHAPYLFGAVLTACLTHAVPLGDIGPLITRDDMLFQPRDSGPDLCFDRFRAIFPIALLARDREEEERRDRKPKRPHPVYPPCDVDPGTRKGPDLQRMFLKAMGGGSDLQVKFLNPEGGIERKNVVAALEQVMVAFHRDFPFVRLPDGGATLSQRIRSFEKSLTAQCKCLDALYLIKKECAKKMPRLEKMREHLKSIPKDVAGKSAATATDGREFCEEFDELRITDETACAETRPVNPW